ncbi:hypothetical protein [Novosphingobium panipatense]
MASITREEVAYFLIAMMILVPSIVYLKNLPRKKREALRRRGVKTHGH